MPNTTPPPDCSTMPYPFHILCDEGNRRILMNMRLDMLYLQEWTGSYWKNIIDMHIDDYNRIAKILDLEKPPYED